MENRLIRYFSKMTLLSKEEEEALTKSMEVKQFSKGDFIVREGSRNKDTFFVLEGLVRQFQLSDGDEITTGFYRDGQWIISLTDFMDDSASAENLVCAEDTSLVVGNEKKAQDLFRQFPRFEAISRMVMEKVFAEQQRWMKVYLTDSPEDRYLKLLKRQPDIFQKVPQYHIATYIGVKPESLSRIRKRISLKG